MITNNLREATANGYATHGTEDGITTLCGKKVAIILDSERVKPDCRICRVKMGTLRNHRR